MRAPPESFRPMIGAPVAGGAERLVGHATEEGTRRAAEIFANPFYQAMSSTFAGTQFGLALRQVDGELPLEGSRKGRQGGRHHWVHEGVMPFSAAPARQP